MKLDNTSTAGIKADRWIKKMSMLPTAMVEHRDVRNSTRCVERKTTSPLYHEFGSGAFYKEIERIVGKKAYDANEYRALPYEKSERDQRFKPMIEPFEPGQVRYVPFKETLSEFMDRCDKINQQIPDGHPDKRAPGFIVDVKGDTVGGQYVQAGMRKILSFGTTSMGYDVRLAETFSIFSNVNAAIVDPKRFDSNCLVDGKLNDGENGEKYVIIPPNSYLLGHTIEVFDIPNDVLVMAIGKSTYARAGAIVNVTPIEPGFKGTVVIEISNSTPLPLKIYANEGISQFVFFEAAERCDVSYADRGGKYQNQQGLVLPRV